MKPSFIVALFLLSTASALPIIPSVSTIAQAQNPNPSSAIEYFDRGIFYARQGKSDLALADLNQAIELDPNLAPAYYNRGTLYAEQGKNDLALADYDRAIELDPNDAPAYNNRGSLYAEQGKNDLALSDLKTAKQLFIEQGDTTTAERIDNYLQNLP